MPYIRFSKSNQEQLTVINMCDNKDVEECETGQVIVSSRHIRVQCLGVEQEYTSERGFTLSNIVGCLKHLASTKSIDITGCAICSDGEVSDLTVLYAEGRCPAIAVVLHD